MSKTCIAAAADLRRAGFATTDELEAWLDFVEWLRDPDGDASLYEFEQGRGWRKVVTVHAGDVRNFINALADVLVADLLRIGTGKG